MSKKKISKEDLKQVLGGIKSNILNEMEAERGNRIALAHAKYFVDHYSKGNIAIRDRIGSQN